MIKIEVGKDTIDKALKSFKRKMDKTGVLRELRLRKEFEKKSVRKRKQKIKAIWVEKTYKSVD
jgi:small subunit ribosomal protein S21